MQSTEELVIEQAKTLALTLSLFNSKCDKLIGEFNQKLTKAYTQLNESQLSAQKSIDYISENVAYQSNLLETKNELTSQIDKIREDFTNYSLFYQNPYSVNTTIDDLVSTTVYTSPIVASEPDNLDDFIKNNEVFLNYLSNIVKTNYEFLLNSIGASNKNLDDISKKLSKGIDNVDFKLDKFKSETNKDINDIVKIIDDIKSNIQNQLVKTFKELDVQLNKSIDNIVHDISLINNKIDSNADLVKEELNHIDVILETKSDVDHTHNDILNSIDILQENQNSIENELNSVLLRLQTKPEYSEILLKSDLDKLKKDIINLIPIPKDGKDADDWEFKPHPTRKGILIFKKQSQKNWNYIDLNHIVPKIQEYTSTQQRGINFGNGFAGGGGGGGGSSLSILWNNILVSTKSNINFTGSAITSVITANDITTVRIDAGTSGGGSNSPIIKFSKPLTGTNVVVNQSEHNITEIVEKYVKNSSGKIVEVSITELNNTITVDSNVALDNLTLFLFGYQSILKYQKPLSGFNVVVLQAEHGITTILSFEVRNSIGKLIEVAETLNTLNNTITIQSNVDLTNCILTIKGT